MADPKLRVVKGARWAFSLCCAGYSFYKVFPYLWPDSHAHLSKEKYEKLSDRRLLDECQRLVSGMKLQNADRLNLVVSKEQYSYPESHGWLKTGGGAYISLPRSFLPSAAFSSTVESADLFDKLSRIMRPTQEMRLFVLAHELNHVKRGDSLIAELLQPLGAWLGYMTYGHVLLKRSLLFPSVTNSLLMSVGLASIYVLARVCLGLFTHWSEMKADEDAALMGEPFARGGVQFCDKMMMVNQAVRDLNPVTRFVFTEDGENSADLINPRFCARRKKLEEIRLWWVRERTQDERKEVLSELADITGTR